MAEIRSINPATGAVLATFASFGEEQIERVLQRAKEESGRWRRTSFEQRGELLRRAGAYLRRDRERLAGLITAEMGKPIVEAEGEIEKCAWVCDYYAEHGARFLADEPRESSARESYVEFNPLGVVLAIMPWNFPFWQLMRFAAPALMAGNTAILKHASNVPQCALAAEQMFRECGCPDGVFQTALVAGAEATRMIEDPRIAAVTLTGSEEAGSIVAATAGKFIKKTVLELGGSDPFIVLEDADLDAAVETGVRARFQNAGQSCIAAKRFIVVDSVFDDFERRYVQTVKSLRIGDPMDRTTQIGPLARNDLRDGLEKQVQRSLAGGGRLVIGGERLPGRGYFFAPTVVSEVDPATPLACEEVFGPVAALMRVANTEEAVRVANQCAYGLGSSLWTKDISRARVLARQIEAGMVFINGMVVSDPRLPFGGVKLSGYGRELADYGIREFVNIKTVWIGPKGG
jgi:succinate-semialdehyde dehydrogenase / glutarate-semialdehyde dehydrogenase